MKSISCILAVLLVGAVLGGQPSAEEKPVTIQVIDAETGKPVKRFRYSYEFISPDRYTYPPQGKNLPAQNDRGEVIIPAPRRLGLLIRIDSPDHRPKEWEQYAEFKVFPDDERRRFEIKLKPGEPIRGVVLDARHGKPVAGVEVAPKDAAIFEFGANVFPTWQRSVLTDQDGRFLVGGNPALGVATRRKGYRSTGIWREDSPPKRETRQTPDGQTELVLRLRRYDDPNGEDWRGVTDRSNIQPTGNRRFRVLVTLADDPQAEGTCTVIAAAVRDKTWWFDDMTPEGHPRRTEDHVRLENAALGEFCWPSVPSFADDQAYYVAAFRAGFAPAVIRISTKEDAYRGIGLREPEAVIETHQFVDLELNKGVRVSGQVEGPGVADGTAVAMLFPWKYLCDWRFDNELEWLTRTATVRRDGTFQFDQIEAGLFRLQLLSPKAGPYERMVIVGDEDKQLDPCRMAPFGRIEGIMYDLKGMYYTNVRDQPVGPRALSLAQWSRPTILREQLGRETFPPEKFVTDEHGRFVIDPAPAGKVPVGFRYRMSNDCEDLSQRDVVVPPNGIGRVALNAAVDRSERGVDLPLDIVIGDGLFDAFCAAWGRRDRPPKDDDARFSWFIEPNDDFGIQCRLSPIDRPEGEPTERRVWSEELESGSQRVVLDHVAPGRYRLTIVPDQGWDANPPLFERDIQIAASTEPAPIRVTLPASSVDLKLECSNGRVKGYVRYAVFEEGRERPCREGGFYGSYTSDPKPRCEALHLLPPGQYKLRLWEDEDGWVGCGPIHVKSGQIAGAGTLTLQLGAAVTGRVVFDRESRLPDAVTLVDSAGLRRHTLLHWVQDAFVFEAKSLWPGRWTAQVTHGEDAVMVERPFDVRSLEPVELQLKGE